jgi:hypothetical protein
MKSLLMDFSSWNIYRKIQTIIISLESNLMTVSPFEKEWNIVLTLNTNIWYSPIVVIHSLSAFILSFFFAFDFDFDFDFTFAFAFAFAL